MEFISFIIGLIGGCASLISLYLILPRKVTWRSVEKAVKFTIHKIKVEMFEPDIVLLYGRGGAIYGGLLAGNLGNVKVSSIDRSIINDSGHLETRLLNVNFINDIKNKNILLVTGEVVTGNQLAKAVKSIKRKNPSKIKTCSYYVCTTSSFYPDYYFKECSKPISVPWRILKNYKRTSKIGLT